MAFEIQTLRLKISLIKNIVVKGIKRVTFDFRLSNFKT